MNAVVKNTIRIGCGFDVHALRSGIPLLLGGVLIPHHSGLAGHSDGDVLLHAVSDALLGAAALGDIGLFFPATDERWRGADSGMLLKEVVKKIHEKGWQVGNVDTIIIAQSPRLQSFIQAISARLAGLLRVEQSAVSVKATTTDELGFIGRQEGIAAKAVALLQATG